MVNKKFWGRDRQCLLYLHDVKNKKIEANDANSRGSRVKIRFKKKFFYELEILNFFIR